MDNLTHSLIGAAIGQTGLKKLSGLGMATLIIAANIPDIDAACFLWLDGHEHLAFRRGITHGPPAMLILPALLTAAIVGFDRWQTRRGTRPDVRLPVRPWQLFLLALIGTISHPAADWLNNYGVRLLEPFSSRWFYGDTLFIIDVWLWAILIGGWFWARRAEKDGGNWMRRGQVVVLLLLAYIGLNNHISREAVRAASTLNIIDEQGRRQIQPTLVVASAAPLGLMFHYRDVYIRAEGEAVWMQYRWPTGLIAMSEGVRTRMSDPRIAVIAARNGQVRSFLFWSRMPVARFTATELILTDQRYTDPRVADRFTVRAPLSEAP